VTFRRFTDKNGTNWEVWEVIPLMADRRHEDRRVATERRRVRRPDAKDRRIASRRINASTKYVRVSRGFEDGWLCFAAGSSVRRLAPIPADWNAAPTEQLELWVDLASASWKCSSIN
jgi:hypothetical protein